jgi:thiamine pyrophosphokinase
MEMRALVGEALVTVIRRRTTLHGEPGSLLTLLPVGGPARGVGTKALRYPLVGEELFPASTRGVSNEFLEPVAIVDLEHGVLLAVQPTGGVR